MVNTNKILTVSYGTFSCTLEGFDDSFGTMKAIAEYFRDLAADDRYFGAEPPSPDAEMLARIAEREISRRVEAHRDKDTFVLRADPSTMLPMAAKAPAGAAPSQPEAAPVVQPASLDEAEDRLATPAAEPVMPAAKAPADPDSVAAKLQRIRDVVAKSEAESTYSEDEHADDSLLDDDASAETFLTSAQNDITAALEADEAADEDARRAAEKQAEAEAAAARAEEDARANAAAKAAAEAEAAAEEDRIRIQALAQAEAEAAAEADTAQDDSVFDQSDDTKEEEGISAMLDRLSAADGAGETDPANDAPQEEPFVGDDEDAALAPVRARIIKMKKADFEAAISDGYIEEDESGENGGEDSSLSREEEEELMQELAAVEAELAANKAPSKATNSAFENDDEDEEDAFADDLARNAFEDDSIGEDTAGNLFSEDDSRTDANVSSTVRAMRSAHLTETASDAQMGRILEETNTKLNEDEGRGRRNVIAHLRAAVQATEAERDMGGDLGADGRDTEVYRDDLETAVRPRRPVANPSAGTRPETRRPAPLKLVAEQRIDTPKPEGPVRPRRIRVTQKLVHDKIPQAADGFADYVESVGAQNLGEVLEAAASFMSFVEGQEAFSRPQLMSKLKGTDHANTTREDRLRSFGQLLRAGKIRKLGGGQFEASEEISYRPSARAAGSK